jgi:hypothetical protein
MTHLITYSCPKDSILPEADFGAAFGKAVYKKPRIKKYYNDLGREDLQ